MTLAGSGPLETQLLVRLQQGLQLQDAQLPHQGQAPEGCPGWLETHSHVWLQQKLQLQGQKLPEHDRIDRMPELPPVSVADRTPVEGPGAPETQLEVLPQQKLQLQGQELL